MSSQKGMVEHSLLVYKRNCDHNQRCVVVDSWSFLRMLTGLVQYNIDHKNAQGSPEPGIPRVGFVLMSCLAMLIRLAWPIEEWH